MLLQVRLQSSMQLQRAHALAEVSRDLKTAVAKEKKRRLKQAAGLGFRVWGLGFRV